ncbi:MAG: hypothetical protein HY912_00570 [Desulfomonile tiedjei]|uniref:Uncharacterized protein n=1 Tax=Desulfomonile tiedjei TaxID=2358 RepID=A0A9D6V0U6_9BACT|nr:hypothetical protein [Desulfomonile tiedjei]
MEHRCVLLTLRSGRSLLVGIMVFAFSLASLGVTESQTTQFPDLVSYSVQGYSVDGPLEVASVASKQLILASAPENIVVSLDGKTVSVKDQYSAAAPTNALQKGKRVYVLCKGNEVVVFLLSAQRQINTDH